MSQSNPNIRVGLSPADIEALHRVASYLMDSEGDDYFDNNCPDDHLYNDASRLASLAQFAEQKMQPVEEPAATRVQLSIV
jgi:hypothetical protein